MSNEYLTVVRIMNNLTNNLQVFQTSSEPYNFLKCMLLFILKVLLQAGCSDVGTAALVTVGSDG